MSITSTVDKQVMVCAHPGLLTTQHKEGLLVAGGFQYRQHGGSQNTEVYAVWVRLYETLEETKLIHSDRQQKRGAS